MHPYYRLYARHELTYKRSAEYHSRCLKMFSVHLVLSVNAAQQEALTARFEGSADTGWNVIILLDFIILYPFNKYLSYIQCNCNKYSITSRRKCS